MARNPTRVLLALLALPLTCPAAAQAGEVGEIPRLVVGGGGSDPTYATLSCGLAASSDPTGLVTQDGMQMTGAVTGGPWLVSDPGTTSVTISCTIQTNSEDPETPDSSTVRRTSRSNTVPGNVGVLLDTVTYTRFPSDEVFVCTTVNWSGADGSHTWQYDASDSRPGIQCDRTITIDG